MLPFGVFCSGQLHGIWSCQTLDTAPQLFSFFSQDGGPLTFNAVFVSAQRKAGFVASCRRQPCVPGRFSGHCDLGRSCPALRLMFNSSITSSRQRASLSAMLFAALLPRMFFRASLPAEGSLASTDAPQCIASADVLHRLASLSYRKTSPTLA